MNLVLPPCTLWLNDKMTIVDAEKAKYCAYDYSSQETILKIFLGYTTAARNAPRAWLVFDYAKQLETKYKGATELQGRALDTAVSFGDRVQKSWQEEKAEQKREMIKVGLSSGAGGLGAGLLIALILLLAL